MSQELLHNNRGSLVLDRMENQYVKPVIPVCAVDQ